VKAWQLHGYGIENLRRTCDLPVPQPGSHELLVRIAAVSLNYRDKLVVEGFYNPNVRFPMIQVADAVGEVVGMGSDVSRFRKGDRVITLYATKWIDGEPQGDENTHTLGSTISGALAEYIVLDENAVVFAPQDLSDEEAAALPCAAVTAWYALVEKGRLEAGQTVLVQGTGGVSLFGLQIASALGATVIVTSRSDEKLERAKKLGAAHGVNYACVPEWENAVLELTSGKGVDHILEVVGGKNLGQSLKAIKPGGQISVIGLLEDVTSQIPLFSLFKKQAVLRGISTGPRRALEEMVQAFSRMRLHPVIDHVYQFDDALAAYAHLYRGSFGKIVIRV